MLRRAFDMVFVSSEEPFSAADIDEVPLWHSTVDFD
jgi:hypothetical protein